MIARSWDETLIAIAKTIALRSKCTRFQAGAVIVDATNRIVATGYNGPPANEPSSQRVPACISWCERAGKDPKDLEQCYTDCISIHAEANALLFCDRREREGGTIYVNGEVCWDCAKLIANSGLKRVVQVSQGGFEHRRNDRSMMFMAACGLEVTCHGT